jgi:glycogen synthase
MMFDGVGTQFEDGWIARCAPDLVGKRIAYLTPELLWSQVGGLGPIADELARALAQGGLETIVISLLYRRRAVYDLEKRETVTRELRTPADYRDLPTPLDLQPVTKKADGISGMLEFPLLGHTVRACIWKARLGQAQAYLIEHLPGEGEPDLTRDAYGLWGHYEKIAQSLFVAHSALQLFKELEQAPDILHVNDWSPALTPLVMKAHPAYAGDPLFAHVKVVTSSHTPLAAGRFRLPAHYFDVLERDGIAREHFGGMALPDTEDIDFVHGSMFHSDACNGVSEEASELLGKIYPNQAHKIQAVTNGIDVAYWRHARLQNPKLTPEKLVKIKRDLKAWFIEEVEKRSGVKLDLDRPIITRAARLAGLKGLDLTLIDERNAEVMVRDREEAGMGAQVVLMSHPVGDGRTGEWQDRLRRICAAWPDRYVYLPYFDHLFAKCMYAGGDILVFPSRSRSKELDPLPGLAGGNGFPLEASGTSFMMAMVNGCPIVASRTGAMSEAISEFYPDTDGTGFLFGPAEDPDYPRMFRREMWKATALYYDRPDLWRKLMWNAWRAGERQGPGRIDIRLVAWEYATQLYRQALLEFSDIRPGVGSVLEVPPGKPIRVRLRLPSVLPLDALALDLWTNGPGGGEEWHPVPMRPETRPANGSRRFYGQLPPAAPGAAYEFTIRGSANGELFKWAGRNTRVAARETAGERV